MEIRIEKGTKTGLIWGPYYCNACCVPKTLVVKVIAETTQISLCMACLKDLIPVFKKVLKENE